MKINKNVVVALCSATGVYLLIAFEFFYMASPFAMYFYSVYKPGLHLLNEFPSISWVTGFFLPHLVEDTKSVLLDHVPVIGVIMFTLGLSTFVICAGQIYYAKLFKKKIVTKGFYRFVRHPQYAAFAICSFGLLLLWPRYLNLFFYIVLLFVYYWLALIEENECEQKYGKVYLKYKENTAMFFPLPKQVKIPIAIPTRFVALVRLGFYILITTLLLLIAYGLKNLSVQQLYSYSSPEGSWISIFKMEEAGFKSISHLMQNNSAIDSLITRKAGSKDELINYVLPAEMYISEIPMIEPKNSKCHVERENYNQNKVKVVITKSIHKEKEQTFYGNKLIRKTLTLKPVAEVWIDRSTQTITRIIDLPEPERYKNIPEPVF